jgi:hypothetical protein
LEHDEDQDSLYESIKRAEQTMVRGAHSKPFTKIQQKRVVDHLLEMMAQTRLKAVPRVQREKFEQHDGFDRNEHFAEWLRGIWSGYNDLVNSPQIYGANLDDLNAVQKLIEQIVIRDKLPPKNSLEAAQLLRGAWNTVDICAHNVNKYKLVARASFLVGLALSLIIIVITVFRVDIDERADDDNFSSDLVFITATMLTVLTGMIAFFNPDQRWRELRAVAESMQSEIF